MGAMFFSDPKAAFEEMLRVIKPGGVVSMVVWHRSDVNPFCYVVTNVMARHVNSPPTDPDAPNAFRFAEEGQLAGVLSEAGAVDIQEHLLKFNIEAPLSAVEFWAMRSATSGTLREKLATLPGDEVLQIGTEVVDAVREYFPAGQMRFPASMLIVTGRKSH